MLLISPARTLIERSRFRRDTPADGCTAQTGACWATTAAWTRAGSSPFLLLRDFAGIPGETTTMVPLEGVTAIGHGSGHRPVGRSRHGSVVRSGLLLERGVTTR